MDARTEQLKGKWIAQRGTSTHRIVMDSEDKKYCKNEHQIKHDHEFDLDNMNILARKPG